MVEKKVCCRYMGQHSLRQERLGEVRMLRVMTLSHMGKRRSEKGTSYNSNNYQLQPELQGA